MHLHQLVNTIQLLEHTAEIESSFENQSWPEWGKRQQRKENITYV